MSKLLLYFGCIDRVGHYLFGKGGASASERNAMSLFPSLNPNLLKHIDAIFPPTQTQIVGKYNECIVPPCIIVAWWDRSVDKRPGSNSNLIGFGYANAEEIIDEAYIQFPAVMNRQPRPVKFELK